MRRLTAEDYAVDANVTLPDDARILRCDGSLSYVISIVEANGNRYLFCERI
jgi:hypothetical protein